jgi:hypothetical protein
MSDLTKCRHYLDKGSELTDCYCPTGFRFLTNTDWIGRDGCAEQRTVDLVQNCWKFYDSVAVGPAFACNGFMMHDMIAIYVKQAVPVRLGHICSNCGGCYESKDIVPVETYFREGKKLCKNCFHVYSYEDIVVGNEIVLVDRCRF